MTKQEQIEEMAHIMCEYYNKGFCANGDITEICEDMPYCCYKNDAEALYNAGYRKADDVHKETAKVILYMLHDMGIDKETLECCRIYDVNGVSLVEQICEKYGVEVEK